MNPPEYSSPDFKSIAELDVARLCKSFYKAAGRPGQAYADDSRTDCEVIIARGRGPTLCVTRGYGDFKASYHMAANTIKASVVPYLTGTENRLVLHFVSCSDGSVCGTSNHHQYIIYKKV